MFIFYFNENTQTSYTLNKLHLYFNYLIAINRLQILKIITINNYNYKIIKTWVSLKLKVIKINLTE